MRRRGAGGAGGSDEGPALHDLHDEVLARRQRLVAVRGAALRAPEVQVAVQPQPELAAATTGVLSTLDSIHIYTSDANILTLPRQLICCRCCLV